MTGQIWSLHQRLGEAKFREQRLTNGVPAQMEVHKPSSTRGRGTKARAVPMTRHFNDKANELLQSCRQWREAEDWGGERNTKELELCTGVRGEEENDKDGDPGWTQRHPLDGEKKAKK